MRTMKAERWRGVSTTCSLVLTACGTPVGVKRMDATAEQRSLRRSILTSVTLSTTTRNVIFRHDLETRWEDDPRAAIAAMHPLVVQDSTRHNETFALAEPSFAYAEQAHDAASHRAAAVDAWLLLFPTDQKSSSPSLALGGPPAGAGSRGTDTDQAASFVQRGHQPPREVP